MNNILQARELHTSATWHSHAQKSPTGAIAKRKPDIFLLDTQKVPKSKTGTIHWRDVLVVGELKQSDANNSKADMQLASYAHEVFGAQMNRRFVFGITICGFRMRVWLFDRAGGISSQTFNINDDPKAFFNVIIGFATIYHDDRGALGYDMTISSSRNGIGAITVGSKGFILDEIVYSHPVVSGRATICWKAHKQGEPGTVYAIKDSWQLSTRGEEGSMLKEVTEALKESWDDPSQPLVAQHYRHEDVHINDMIDNTNNIRKNVKPASPLQAPVNRIHTRMVISTFGRPIFEFATLKELVCALRDAIKGHWLLHEKAKVLHRDISLYNIIIAEHGQGCIINLNYAINIDTARKPQSSHRTRTPPFITINVLRGGKEYGTFTHRYRDDMESFFYDFLWICCMWESSGEERKEQPLKLWMEGDLTVIARNKAVMMIDKFEFER